MERELTQLTFIIRQVFSSIDDPYIQKMDVFDDLINLFVSFKQYGLLTNGGFHNEQILHEPSHFEFITFPLSIPENVMEFDYIPILESLKTKLEELLRKRSYEVEEDFQFNILGE